MNPSLSSHYFSLLSHTFSLLSHSSLIHSASPSNMSSMLTLQRTPLMTSLQFLRHLTAVRASDYRVWSQLAPELLLRVFVLLDPFSLLRCSQVCIAWRRLAHDEALWEALFLRMYPLWSVASGIPRPVSLRFDLAPDLAPDLHADLTHPHHHQHHQHHQHHNLAIGLGHIQISSLSPAPASSQSTSSTSGFPSAHPSEFASSLAVSTLALTSASTPTPSSSSISSSVALSRLAQRSRARRAALYSASHRRHRNLMNTGDEAIPHSGHGRDLTRRRRSIRTQSMCSQSMLNGDGGSGVGGSGVGGSGVDGVLSGGAVCHARVEEDEDADLDVDLDLDRGADQDLRMQRSREDVTDASWRLFVWGVQKVQEVLCGRTLGGESFSNHRSVLDLGSRAHGRGVWESRSFSDDLMLWRSYCLHHEWASRAAENMVSSPIPWWGKLVHSHACFELRRQARRILVIGASESKQTYHLLWDEGSPFQMHSMGPGHPTGLGSGVSFRSRNLEVVMLSCYAAQLLKRNPEAWSMLCQGVSGLIIFLDAQSDQHDQVRSELFSLYHGVAAGTPFLHIAITNNPSTTACEVAETLRLYDHQIYWRLYKADVNAQSTQHLEAALHWLSDAILDNSKD